MCKKDYDFFTEHFDELYDGFKDKFIAIKECKVIGAYDSFDEAISKTIETEELGTFIVQQCVKKDESAYNNFYSNNVVFSVV